MGVRQANWPAAAAVFVVYTLNAVVVGLSVFSPAGIVRIAFAFVLLSNVRAAFLASEWKPSAEDVDRPTRFSETLADKYIDQMPAKLWPKMQIPFLVLAITMLLLSLAGAALIVATRFGLVPHH